MDVRELPIGDLKLIRPTTFRDTRGSFFESWNDNEFRRRICRSEFVQDNQSISRKHVLRGLHYQIDQPQAKLVRVSRGSAFDVAVDLRKSSPTFGKHFGTVLSARNNLHLWIPEGFAHGFLALSDHTVFQYKCSDYYLPAAERTLIWNDTSLAIEWPLPPGQLPIVSERDQLGVTLEEADLFP